MQNVKITVSLLENGQRLDVFVSNICEISRTFAALIITDGLVMVNTKQVKKNHVLCDGDIVSVSIPHKTESEIKPQNISLDIVFEDDDIIVLNKPKGMVVHPGAGNWDNTLANALLYHSKEGLSELGGEARPGIVHRLDKDTSGLLVAAKNDVAHKTIAKQFEQRTTLREYHGMIYGRLLEQKGVVDSPIGRSQKDRKKMSVDAKRIKQAITNYEVIAEYQGFSHVAFHLGTGRTHQIRVHMASLGHPIAGDAVYGPKKVIKKLRGQCLHAKKIGFVHPKSGEYLEFNSELPEYFQSFINEVERKSGG